MWPLQLKLLIKSTGLNIAFQYNGFKSTLSVKYVRVAPKEAQTDKCVFIVSHPAFTRHPHVSPSICRGIQRHAESILDKWKGVDPDLFDRCMRDLEYSKAVYVF